MLKILLNNEYLEIAQETIKYTKQCNDISDLSSRETNYTDSFSIPKTPNNIQIFEGLGLNNDVSQIPYLKNTAQILDNGMPLVKNGWLDVKETTSEFKINIYDGIIDLFKAIENKTFGEDVDLSEINHEKDLPTIVASFTNEDYRYIINDFGGKTHLSGGEINVDFLVPSVRVKYLWDKIFTTFGFNYVGNIFNSSDFEGLWLSYPKGVESPVLTLYCEFLDFDYGQGILYNLARPNNLPFNTVNFFFGNVMQSNKYVIPETGYYKMLFKGIEEFSQGFSGNFFRPISLRVNGVTILNNQSFNEISIILPLNIGDVVDTANLTRRRSGTRAVRDFRELKIYKFTNTDVSFTDEFKQLRITDFFKEIINRFALTIFINKDGNYIFKTFDERLQSGVVDWSEKYHSRFSETYTVKSYAQQNIFKQEYQDERNDYNDGFFSISNIKLLDTKIIINSKIFSAEKDLISFNINNLSSELVTPTLLWDKDPVEGGGINYKPLNKRFYFLRNKTINKNAVLKSEIIGASQSVTSLPIANFNITSFKDFVPKYYGNIEFLLNEFRMHKIKLALNSIDFINLDFDKIYYFLQEQNYYILNKITFEGGKLSNAEFYRIRYTEVDLCSNFIANDDSITISLGDEKTINILSNDVYPYGTLSVNIITPPTNGTAVVNEDNTITYTHDGVSVLNDFLVYELSNGVCSDTATLYIYDSFEGALYTTEVFVLKPDLITGVVPTILISIPFYNANTLFNISLGDILPTPEFDADGFYAIADNLTNTNNLDYRIFEVQNNIVINIFDNNGNPI